MQVYEKITHSDKKPHCNVCMYTNIMINGTFTNTYEANEHKRMTDSSGLNTKTQK